MKTKMIDLVMEWVSQQRTTSSLSPISAISAASTHSLWTDMVIQIICMSLQETRILMLILISQQYLHQLRTSIKVEIIVRMIQVALIWSKE